MNGMVGVTMSSQTPTKHAGLSTFRPQYDDETFVGGEFNAVYTPRSAPAPGSPAESGEYGRFSLRGLGSPGVGEIGGGSPRPRDSSLASGRLKAKTKVDTARPITAYQTSSASYGSKSPLSGELQKAGLGGRTLFTSAGRSTDTEYLGVYGSSAISCHVSRSRQPCVL